VDPMQRGKEKVGGERGTYCKYDDSADTNSDQKDNLFVVAAVVELPVQFHEVKLQDRKNERES